MEPTVTDEKDDVVYECVDDEIVLTLNTYHALGVDRLSPQQSDELDEYLSSIVERVDICAMAHEIIENRKFEGARSVMFTEAEQLATTVLRGEIFDSHGNVPAVALDLAATVMKMARELAQAVLTLSNELRKQKQLLAETKTSLDEAQLEIALGVGRVRRRES